MFTYKYCVAAELVYTQALHALVTAGYLKPSTILSHLSPRDKRIRYEGEEKAKIVGFPTAKELREAKETAEARLKREEEEAEKVGIVSVLRVCRGILCKPCSYFCEQKRKAKEQKGPRSGKVSSSPHVVWCVAEREAAKGGRGGGGG